MGEVTVVRTGRYWLDDEGLLRGVVTEGSDFGLKDAMEMMELHRKLAAGQPRGLMVDITAIKAMPREVRAYFQSPEHAEIHKAVALVVGSPLSRAIGNFFLGLNKPAMPMRLFSDEERAIEWLRQMTRQG